MSNAPDVFVTKNGNEVVTRTIDGRKWNRSWYWEEVRKKAPEMFDANNNYLIDEGISPRVNDQFVGHNPQFVNFKGEALHHHHFKQGNTAYALPRKLHVGKGFTKLWHKFGKKAIIIAGPALAIYEMVKDGNLFSESPFDLWIKEEVDDLEISMIEVAISQGYSATKNYVENCRSCSNLAVCFVDYGEIMQYLATGVLPNDVNNTFSKQLPKDAREARHLLNKAVEFGILLKLNSKGCQSLGIINL